MTDAAALFKLSEGRGARLVADSTVYTDVLVEKAFQILFSNHVHFQLARPVQF